MLKYPVLKDILKKLKISKETLVTDLTDAGQRQSALNLQNWNEIDGPCQKYLEKALVGFNNNSITETNY